MKRFRIIVAIVFPILILAVFMNTILTYASPTGVFTVTNVNDSGSGSLRQAILDANDTGGHDTIEFDLPPSSTIVLGGTQLPVISDSLTIDGSTAVSLTISGNNQSRVLEVGAGANFTLTHLSLVQGLGTFGALLYVNDDEMNNSVVNVYNTYFVGNADAFGRGIRNSYGIVTIQDSIIRNNLSGGGIYNLFGTLTVDNTVIENNDVSYGNGGGIYNHGGTLNVHNSVVRANYAKDGGGIYNIVGTVVIHDSIVDNNAVNNGYGGGIHTVSGIITLAHSTVISNYGGRGGGGIYLGGSLSGDKGTITIEQSSIEQNLADNGGGISIEYGLVNINKSMISNNSAKFLGGGINNSYGLNITNSTIYSNTAAHYGGGIISAGRPITIMNSTVSGNSASYGGGIAFVANGDLTLVSSTIINNEAVAEGGGVFSDEQQFIAKNSIILNNNAPVGADCENKTTFVTQGVNLFGDGTGCPVAANNLTSSNPAAEINLTIADNGGATLTHDLVPGSQAFDVVLDCTDTLGSAIIQDQRGAPRPNGSACDIGAVESGDFWQLYLPAILK